MTGAAELIGRKAELAVLGDLISNIEERGASVLLRGQPGVGKSSLLEAVAMLARKRGAQVLRASGLESEIMEPFAGLRQLLRPIIARQQMLPRVQREALSIALGGRQGPPPELFLTALAALTLVVDAAAAQPVILLIDDVQWLDAPTVEVLAFVSRRLQQDPVLMFSAVRDGHLVALSDAEASDLMLRELDPESAGELLATVAGPIGLSSAEQQEVLLQAQGNPLALVELPTVWRAAGRRGPVFASAAVPLTVRLENTFAARVPGLPSTTRDALLVAAVDAQGILAEVLAGATRLAGKELTTQDLEPAVAARLLTFDHLHVRFRHPLVRSAVLHHENRRRQQLAHAAMSHILAGEPYRQVWHQAHSVGGADDDIADRLEAGHLESMRRGSVLDAIAALQRSAQLTGGSAPRGRRLLLAAQHAFGLGRADLVGPLVDAAERNDLDEAGRARSEWLRELFSEGKLGDSDRVRELCRLAARCATAEEVDLALDLLASAALRCWWTVESAAVRDTVVRVAEDLTAMQDDPRCISVIAVADPLGQALRTRRHLTVKAAAGVSDTDQLRRLGMAARAVGDDPLAADFFDAAETKLRERGQLGLLSQVLAVQAAVYLDLGKWTRAGQNLQEGRLLARETGQSTWWTGTAAVEAVYEALIGNSDRALRQASEIAATCGTRPAGDFRSLAQLARGAAQLSRGRHAEAYAALLPIFDPSGPCHHPREQLSAVMFLVEAAVGCGAGESIRRLVDGLELIARSTASPILRVHLLYARAMLADDRVAESTFRQGLAEDLTRWPWPRARIELGFGNWLRRRHRPVEALMPLRSALSTFDALGATGWAGQARSALRASGDGSSATGAGTPASALTAQEMHIARLAAQGLSNREIGQQLYLSPRTVGSHLYRIFPKMGVTSRSQLATHTATET